MSDVGRGLPLLSGPAPSINSSNAEIACRKCNKEFNMIFARARKCNHCGYSYCHSCSDYQALMPRTGAETGYDPMHVCSFCIEFLTITASGRQQLKAMSLAKLKKYIGAYNIKIDRAVEKDDLIDAILAARGSNGCLSRANENFYRNYSVPNKVLPGRPRGLFSRQQGQGPSVNPPPAPPRPGSTPEFARPDLEPDNPPPPQSFPQPTYPPRPQAPQPQAPQPQQQQYNPPPHPPPPQPQRQQYNPPPHPPPPQPQYQQYNPPPHPPPRPQSSYTNAPSHNTPPQFHTPPPRPPQAGAYGGGYPGQGAQTNQGPPRTQAPPTPPHYSRPPPQSAPQPQPQPRPAPPRPATTRPATTRPPAQAPQPPPPPRPRAVSTPAPPTLDQLLNMTQAAIGSLGVGALKSILFTNHVNPGQVLEKSDLVKKVLTLVEVEKSDRERQRQAEQREEMERVQRDVERQQEIENQRAAEREHATATAAADVNMGASEDAQSWERNSEGDTHNPHSHSTTPPKPAPMPPKTQGSASTLERTGLCVICQDEEANIAIVDCGHMAMCRGCSDLVMSSSRECPLCRTRIVTEARLLRIFKT